MIPLNCDRPDEIWDCTYCHGLGVQSNAFGMPKRICAMCNGVGKTEKPAEQTNAVEWEAMLCLLRINPLSAFEPRK